MADVRPLQPAQVPVETPKAKPAEPITAQGPDPGLGSDQARLSGAASPLPKLKLVDDLGDYYRSPDDIVSDEMSRTTQLLAAHPEQKEALLAEFQDRLTKQFNMPTPSHHDYRYSSAILKQCQPMLEARRNANYVKLHEAIFREAGKGVEAMRHVLETPEATAHTLLVIAHDTLRDVLRLR